MTDARLELGEDGGDLVLDGDDLERDDGLQTAVLISLMSDAREDDLGATPSGLPADSRGWWADTVRDRFGSKLWTLEREKRTQETLERAREFGVDALQWMIEDGIASLIQVTPSYDSFGRLILEIQITRGTARRYASLWAGTSQVTLKIGEAITAPTPIEPPPPPPPPPPVPDQNVVIFLLDDGGAEYFSWSGLLQPQVAGFALTPRMNEMRARGVTFLEQRATSICGPTRACVQTGKHSFRPGNGLGGNLDGLGATGFGLGDYSGVQTAVLLSRALRLGRDGTADQTLGSNAFTYASAWFGKGHLFSDGGEEIYPTSHGWGRYVGCPPNAQSMENWPVGQLAPFGPLDPGYVTPHVNSGHFHFREITTSFGAAIVSETYGASGTWPAGGHYVAWDPTTSPRSAWDAFKVYRDAISWINTRTQPFLAKVCLNPPHAPFETPPYTFPDTVGIGATGLTKNLISPATQTLMSSLNGGAGGPGFAPTDPNRLRQVFKANIEAIDTLIGMFWDRMDPAKRDRTVFMLSGDNGTVTEAVDAPYEGGHSKRTIFEQGVRVPFFVWGSTDVIAFPGRTCSHYTHVTDIFSTALDIMGCEPEAWNPGAVSKIDGKSFLPVLRSPSAEAARTFVYNEIFLPLGGQFPGNPSGTPPIPAVNVNQWLRSYTAGGYKIMKNVPSNPTPFMMFKITSENQPGSGRPGYLELPADDLYRYAIDGHHPELLGIFNGLLDGMNALLAS